MRTIFANTLLATALFFSTLNSAQAFIKMLIVPKKIDLNFDKRMVNATYIINRSKSTANQSIDYEFDVLRQVKDVKMLFGYYATGPNGAATTPLIKREINFCLFLRRPNSDRLLSSIYDHVKKHNHLPLRCPIDPGSYYIRNMRLADIPLPGFLPEAEFFFELIFRTAAKSKPLAEYFCHGKLVRFVDKLFA